MQVKLQYISLQLHIFNPFLRKSFFFFKPTKNLGENPTQMNQSQVKTQK